MSEMWRTMILEALKEVGTKTARLLPKLLAMTRLGTRSNNAKPRLSSSLRTEEEIAAGDTPRLAAADAMFW